ncbi:hypothetical protein V5799_026951 [Amblyomma americanum]|uniref:Uncharacterized protein n=1 Tax=Amblyomma americanum TaxID=6943 RepID=A0AAQ4DH40_AMBAM
MLDEPVSRLWWFVIVVRACYEERREHKKRQFVSERYGLPEAKPSSGLVGPFPAAHQRPIPVRKSKSEVRKLASRREKLL